MLRRSQVDSNAFPMMKLREKLRRNPIKVKMMVAELAVEAVAVSLLLIISNPCEDSINVESV